MIALHWSPPQSFYLSSLSLSFSWDPESRVFMCDFQDMLDSVKVTEKRSNLHPFLLWPRAIWVINLWTMHDCSLVLSCHPQVTLVVQFEKHLRTILRARTGNNQPGETLMQRIKELVLWRGVTSGGLSFFFALVPPLYIEEHVRLSLHHTK